jgi:hypothetical protein
MKALQLCTERHGKEAGWETLSIEPQEEIQLERGAFRTIDCYPIQPTHFEAVLQVLLLTKE